MAEEQGQTPKRRRDTIVPERLMRRVLEGVGDAVDRKLGRTPDTESGITTDVLIRRMNAMIDERVRDDKRRGRIAPHDLKLKIEWGKHSETPPEVTRRLAQEVLAAAIDHINDSRYRTLAPVKIETDVDIFTKGIAVDPTFGEFEDQLRQEDLERKPKRRTEGAERRCHRANERSGFDAGRLARSPFEIRSRRPAHQCRPRHGQ